MAKPRTQKLLDQITDYNVAIEDIAADAIVKVRARFAELLKDPT